MTLKQKKPLYTYLPNGVYYVPTGRPKAPIAAISVSNHCVYEHDPRALEQAIIFGFVLGFLGLWTLCVLPFSILSVISTSKGLIRYKRDPYKSKLLLNLPAGIIYLIMGIFGILLNIFCLTLLIIYILAT